MHQKKQNLLVLSVVLLSSLIGFYLLDVNYFPNVSVAFIFLCLATLVHAVKKEKTTFHKALYIIIVILCVFLVIRSSPILTVLNTFSIVFLGSIFSITSKTEQRLISLITSPLLVIVQSIRENNMFRLRLVSTPSQTAARYREKMIETGIVAGISLVTFVVIGALLGSANQQFGHFLESVFGIFNLESLFNFISSHLRVEKLIFAAVFCTMALKYLSLVYSNKTFTIQLTALNRELDLRLPLLISCVLITVFFIFQVDAHFASTQSLSKQTNDIFAQLSAVCVVIFILLINNKYRDRTYRTLKTVLYLQLFYLLFLALGSDVAYISEWGLTHKRLYGLVAIIWIVGMYGLYIKHIDLSRSVKKFYERAVIFTTCLLIAINIVNFDNLIYKYKPSTHVRPVDHVYLAGLSADSTYHFEHFQELRRIEKTIPNTIAQQDEWSFLTNLQKKYKKPDIRTFNLSEYIQYRKIKDLYINPALNVPHILKSE